MKKKYLKAWRMNTLTKVRIESHAREFSTITDIKLCYGKIATAFWDIIEEDATFRREWKRRMVRKIKELYR